MDFPSERLIKSTDSKVPFTGNFSVVLYAVHSTFAEFSTGSKDDFSFLQEYNNVPPIPNSTMNNFLIFISIYFLQIHKSVLQALLLLRFVYSLFCL